MLVTFKSKAHGDFTMLGDDALKLLKLMGHSGTVPSAIRAEDMPAALQKLKAAIDKDEATHAGETDDDEDDGYAERRISLKVRAFPLIEMLEAAVAADVPVMWDS